MNVEGCKLAPGMSVYQSDGGRDSDRSDGR